MRTLLILVSLVPVVACGDGGSGTDAGIVPDARVGVDAGTDTLPPIPVVAPCEVLGLPGPPTIGGTSRAISPRLRDVDGDGKLDLIFADGATVSVLPGNGDATFRASIDSALGSTATGSVFNFFNSIDIVDANGDGKLDLVLTTGPNMAVLTALGDGTGHFSPGPVSAVSASLGVVRGVVTELNGDTKPDIVLIDPSVASVAVRLGAGDGSFASPTTYPLASVPEVVTTADLDGDGKADVIVGNGVLSILRGKGDGTLEARVDRTTPDAPYAIVAGNLNGDSKVDLVVLSNIGLGVLLNDGAGALGEEVVYGEPGRVQSVSLGDITKDGKLDVAVVASAPGAESHLLVFAGNGDGTLQRSVDAPNVELFEAVVGEVTGDQAVDVVVTSSSGAFVVENTGSGALRLPTVYAPTKHSTAIITSDLNHDGHVDVVLANADDSTVDVALGRGARTFADVVSYPVAAANGTPVLEDVTGDGIADLLAPGVGAMQSMLSVLPGNADGSFRAKVDSPIAVFPPYLLVLGDLDGDGKRDIVFAASAANSAGSVAVHLGNGDGSFHAAGALAALDGRPSSLQLEDVNADGRPDVVVGHRRVNCGECGPHPGSDGISAFITNADGTLQAAIAYAGTGGQPAGPLTVDITGDGKPDQVTASTIGLAIAAGNGTGFDSALRYRDPVSGPFSVADIDRDGRLDVVTPGAGFQVRFARCVR